MGRLIIKDGNGNIRKQNVAAVSIQTSFAQVKSRGRVI